jgi:nitrile hydratase
MPPEGHLEGHVEGPAAYANLFEPGDRVRILDLGKPGHVRTPVYVRNKVGVIDRCCGRFENPEERAYGRVGRERIPLYRVRLHQRDLWPDYDGNAGDTLVLEIYHHWLRPA